jgi:hypothetical protein
MTHRSTTLLALSALASLYGGCAMETAPPIDPPHGYDGPSRATYVLASVGVPVPNADGRLAGFDLDGHATTSASDPIGCGQQDFPGLLPEDGEGVDNEGALLLNDVASYLPWFDASAFNARIHDGSLLFVIQLEDVQSLVNDDHVTVALYVARTLDGSAPELEGGELVPGQTFAIDERSFDDETGRDEPKMYFPDARIENGRVVAGANMLPFLMVFPDGSTLDAEVHDAQVRFDLTSDGIANGLIGGGMRTSDLVAGFEARVPELADFAELVLDTRADLARDETGACTQLSLGLVFDGMPASTEAPL